MRANEAIALYRAGKVKKIVFAQVERSGWVGLGLQKDNTQVHYEYLRQQGVPDDAINVLRGCIVTSTYDEARCLRDYLANAQPAQAVTVVTSWFHTSRSAWTFRRVFAGSGVAVHMAAATSDVSSPSTWWEHEQAFLDTFAETLKWPFNVLMRGKHADEDATSAGPGKVPDATAP
jgi:uncharacterized SAM-binding protein YcdF (DUF218 family)